MQGPPDSSHFLIILLSLFTSIPLDLKCSCGLFGPAVSSGQWLLVLRKCERVWALFPWVPWCPLGPLLPKPKLLYSDLTTVGHFTDLLMDHGTSAASVPSVPSIWQSSVSQSLTPHVFRGILPPSTLSSCLAFLTLTSQISGDLPSVLLTQVPSQAHLHNTYQDAEESSLSWCLRLGLLLVPQKDHVNTITDWRFKHLKGASSDVGPLLCHSVVPSVCTWVLYPSFPWQCLLTVSLSLILFILFQRLFYDMTKKKSGRIHIKFWLFLKLYFQYKNNKRTINIRTSTYKTSRNKTRWLRQ